jgi:hypothetical protein
MQVCSSWLPPLSTPNNIAARIILAALFNHSSKSMCFLRKVSLIVAYPGRIPPAGKVAGGLFDLDPQKARNY